VRPLVGDDDIRAIQELASRLWPLGWHPGGLGWALARGELGDEVVVWDGDDGLRAWVARGQHNASEVVIQVDPADALVADATADWVVEEAGPGATAEVVPADVGLAAALASRGFRPSGRPVWGMRRSVHAPEPNAEGYIVREVRPGEDEARVEVHRRAWRPADLPYEPGARGDVSPDATSAFDRAAYDAVRQRWLYDPGLDIVAEAGDGSLAGCCIAWLDPTSGVAEIEPVGVAPEHRRRGVAVAMCHEVAARVRARGGRELFINTGPDDGYPVPSLTYTSAGFETYRRAELYVLG
jgi:ribosomal protein S18 acetylase RimI-like enzyme